MVGHFCCRHSLCFVFWWANMMFLPSGKFLLIWQNNSTWFYKGKTSCLVENISKKRIYFFSICNKFIYNNNKNPYYFLLLAQLTSLLCMVCFSLFTKYVFIRCYMSNCISFFYLINMIKSNQLELFFIFRWYILILSCLIY